MCIRDRFYTRAGYKVIWVFDETYAFGNEYISSLSLIHI